MKTHNLGYPRIGNHRELKHALESYWKGKITISELRQTGKDIRKANLKLQRDAGIDLIPVNDFSFYDHVLDTSLMVGNIPRRFEPLLDAGKDTLFHLYFAMARGYQDSALSISALEMTKWFDTNYHYLVPEFTKNQTFRYFATKVIEEYIEATDMRIHAKPVLLGPVSYLLLGKEKEPGFHRLDLLDSLLPVYEYILKILHGVGLQFVQFDEPCLGYELSDREKQAYVHAYSKLSKPFPQLKIMLATYFGDISHNMDTLQKLPVDTLHIDLIQCPHQLPKVLSALPASMNLSLGLVDGRNIWKTEYDKSCNAVKTAIEAIGKDRILIAPSCSLMHVPCDLDLEQNDESLPAEVKEWMAFAKQKLTEVVNLSKLNCCDTFESIFGKSLRDENRDTFLKRHNSKRIHNLWVRRNMQDISTRDYERGISFGNRKILQQQKLNLPLFPTTTIGSFPQTDELRKARAQFRNGTLDDKKYTGIIAGEIKKAIQYQQDLNIDVLVHGEFERNDMVEYFGSRLQGFAFTLHGWVQSYGSRCVKPPVIYGDISRPEPITVEWTSYAQSLTDKPVKGIVTGPITMLQWSFVRNDQPRWETALQLALVVREEVADLERAGIKIIQVDEPAIREGMPVKKSEWKQYLDWAVKAFRLATSCVNPETQIHTHMCYSEFNDIISAIIAMDADVITMETSRSDMEPLDMFAHYKYPNDIGPGVYDIHSPRIPQTKEMTKLLTKALTVIPAERLWINPDCGLKTRNWDETGQALKHMVLAAYELRRNYTDVETSKKNYLNEWI